MGARIALVTGGGQGIGRGIAERLLRAGWRIIIAERDDEAGQETARDLAALGEIVSLQTDVADEESVRATFATIARRFGRLDGLVNNAGIAQPVSGPVDSLALADWNRVIGVNLTGGFLCVKHAVPLLRERSGAIVNIASTRALQSEPHTEAYAASKGGMVALTHALAVSLGPSIRVNCISPGWIEVSALQKASRRKPASPSPLDHAQHPAGRVGQADDVAALVEFLLSGQAGFITGQNFVVDGGMTRKMIYLEEPAS